MPPYAALVPPLRGRIKSRREMEIQAERWAMHVLCVNEKATKRPHD